MVVVEPEIQGKKVKMVCRAPDSVDKCSKLLVDVFVDGEYFEMSYSFDGPSLMIMGINEVRRFLALLRKNYGITLPEKIAISIPLPKHVGDKIYNELKQVIQRHYDVNWQDFKSGKADIVLRFKQDFDAYDGVDFLTNEWHVSEADILKLYKTFGNRIEDVRTFIKKAYRWATKNNAFEVEEVRYGNLVAHDKILRIDYPTYVAIMSDLSDEEKKRLHAELERIERFLKNDLLLLRDIFVSSVHVDDEGCFSDCPPYCDDCVWMSHLKWDYIKSFPDLLRKCDKFYVRSRKSGKVYTYYEPNNEVLRELGRRHADVVRQAKEKYMKRAQEIRNLLGLT